MSLDAMVWALKHAPVPASEPIAHLVLIGLADHASSDGTEARPSVATLAEYARCSPRTVHNKLRVLENAGLIRRGDQQTVAHIRSDRRPIVYDLAIGGVQDMHPANPVDNPPHGVHDVHTVAPHGVNGRTARGEQPGSHGVNVYADRTVLEPSLNQGGKNQRHSPVDNSAKLPPSNAMDQQSQARTNRCPAHQGLDIAPPCGGCKDARLATERAEAAMAQERAARSAAVAQSPYCTEHTWERSATCRGCASEHKAGEHSFPPLKACRLCFPHEVTL